MGGPGLTDNDKEGGVRHRVNGGHGGRGNVSKTRGALLGTKRGCRDPAFPGLPAGGHVCPPAHRRGSGQKALGILAGTVAGSRSVLAAAAGPSSPFLQFCLSDFSMF